MQALKAKGFFCELYPLSANGEPLSETFGYMMYPKVSLLFGLIKRDK
jgi:hypothetical protein